MKSVTFYFYAECLYAECRYAECRYAECLYAECLYAECRYAECRGAVNMTQEEVLGQFLRNSYERFKVVEVLS